MNPQVLFSLREALGTLNNQVIASRQEQLLLALEDEATRYFSSIFQEQGEDLVESFNHLQHYFAEEMREDLRWILDQTFLHTFPAFRDGILRYSLLSAAFGAQALPTELGLDISFDVVNHQAIELLQRYAAKEVKAINDTTRTRINELVTRGFEQRRSYSQIADDIKKEFREFGVLKPQKHIRNRAELVAVTEIRKAHSATRFAGSMALENRGIPVEKYWHNREDDRVSKGCKTNTEDGWIPLKRPFTSGHYTTPRFPGCRCWTLERVSPKAMGPKEQDKFRVELEGDSIVITPNLQVLEGTPAVEVAA